MRQINWRDIGLTAIIFILVDGLFLNYMTPFFQKMITSIQGGPIEADLVAGVLTYVVLVGGLYYFIILKNQSLFEALLLGWFVYLTYELTNKTILKNWTYLSVLIDGLWGGLLFAITVAIFYHIKNF